MILVVKPPRPAAIMKRGPGETARLRAQRDAAVAAGVAPAYVYDKRIYGSKAVKKHLRNAQHRKCCYCESLVGTVSAGDVEHYRPKGRVEHDPDPTGQGYYWLVYEWDNLFFACPVCNESFKRSLFPLAVETDRVRSHHDPLAGELPLVLDPSGPRDPRDHIVFREDVPRGLSPAGWRTIEVAGLDREDLGRARRKHLKLVRSLLKLRDVHAGSTDADDMKEAADAQAALAEYCGAAGEYWSATQDLLTAHAAAAP